MRDENSRFAWTNRRYELAFGGGRQSLSGLALEEVLPLAQAQSERAADRAALAEYRLQAPHQMGNGSNDHPLGVAGQRKVIAQQNGGVWLLCGPPAPPEPPPSAAEQSWARRVRSLEQHRRLAADYVAAGLAHEIRNPLAALCNAVAVLRRRLAGLSDMDVATAVSIAHEEVWRVERMVAETIAQASTLAPRVREVSVGDILAFAGAAQTGLPLARLSPSDLALKAHADPEQVGTAIDLVFGHCVGTVAAGPEYAAPPLRFGVHSDSEAVRLTIEAPNPLVVPQFEAIEMTSPNPGELQDWALPMANKLLERQGASLECQQTPSGPTRFTLRLPPAAREAERTSATWAASPDRNSPMLIDELKAQMFQAIKARQTVRKEILRTALGEATATGEDPTDEHLLKVLRKLVKANRDTLQSVSDESGRVVLRQEIEVLESFLPAPLSVEQVTLELQDQAAALRAAASQGPAMGIAMRHLKQAGLAAESEVVASAIRNIRGD